MSRTATPCDLIPEAHCVLGTLLRPFSLGHHLLLTRLQSPFASDPEAIATPDDFSLAVFVCAAPFHQTQEAIVRGSWDADFRKWAKQIRSKWWQRTRFNHQAEAGKFATYLRDGYRRPPVMRHTAGAPIVFSAPWECLLEARLAAGGFTPETTRERYLPASWYLYHTLCEIRQAESCADITKWQKIFWTESDEARYRGVSSDRN